jgi:hypothetical protein
LAAEAGIPQPDCLPSPPCGASRAGAPLARRTRPRTIVTKIELEDLYSENSVRMIAENADLGNVDIPRLRKSVISAVCAYLDLLAKEQADIKASRAKRKKEYYWRRKGLLLHTTKENIRTTRLGRKKETSIYILVSTLGAIYHRYTDKWPTREFDRNTNEEIGFGCFVFETTVPIFKEQATLDYYVNRYVNKLKRRPKR